MLSLKHERVFSLLLPVLLMLFRLPAYASRDADHVQNISRNTHLSPKIVQLALEGYMYAAAHAKINKSILTIVDYSQPSVLKRMYVIDLKTDKLLMNLSGGARPQYW